MTVTMLTVLVGLAFFGGATFGFTLGYLRGRGDGFEAGQRLHHTRCALCAAPINHGVLCTACQDAQSILRARAGSL